MTVLLARQGSRRCLRSDEPTARVPRHQFAALRPWKRLYM